MRRLTIELPDEALAALAPRPRRRLGRPGGFWQFTGTPKAGSVKVTVPRSRACHGRSSSSAAAAKVPAIQVTVDELREELADGVSADRQR